MMRTNPIAAILFAATFGLAKAATAAAATAAADKEPPIAVAVYYSADDKHWPETEKAIDAAARKYPRLQIQKISIDTDEGYHALAEAEKRNLVKDHGDITLIMGPLTLTSKGERRDIETYFEPMVERLLNPSEGKGRLPADVPAFVKEIFGAEATTHMLPPTTNENILYFRIEQDGRDIGWVADAYAPIACPVCNDVQMLVATDAGLKVLDLQPVRNLERRGVPLSAKETRSFTAQFKGRKPGKEIKVDGISGASKTTRTYENTLADILQDLRKVKKQ